MTWVPVSRAMRHLTAHPARREWETTMRISRKDLNRIIQEEYSKVLREENEGGQESQWQQIKAGVGKELDEILLDMKQAGVDAKTAWNTIVKQLKLASQTVRGQDDTGGEVSISEAEGGDPNVSKKIKRMLDTWDQLTWGGEREAQNDLGTLFQQLPAGPERQALVRRARSVAGRSDLKESARRALLRVIREDHQNNADPSLTASARAVIEQNCALDVLENAVMECIEHGLYAGTFVDGYPDEGNYQASAAAVESIIDEIIDRNAGPTLAVAQRHR